MLSLLCNRTRLGRCGWFVGEVVLAGLATMALVTGGGCDGGGKSAMKMPVRPPAQVTVALAEARDVPVYLDEIGKTVAAEVVSVVPQVGGKIVVVGVEHGAFVHKGDLLFEIDARPFNAVLASAQASLAQAKAALDLAGVEYRRLQGLENSSAVSQSEVDQKKSAVAVGQAKVAAAEAAVETADLNLAYTRIVSPIDGRAGVRMVDVGNVVKESGAPMIVIERMDPILAEFTITENDLGTVRKYLAKRGLDLNVDREKGLKTLVDIPGDSARVLAALGELLPASRPATSRAGAREGTLVFLDNAVQPGSGTVKLRATLGNADHYFWPGQFVNVRLVLAIRKNAVVIPVQAQQIGQQGIYVYVVKGDETAEIRQITAGQRQGDLLVVDKGLEPGERVVLTGQMGIVPQAKVQIVGAGGAATRPAGAAGVLGAATKK